MIKVVTRPFLGKDKYKDFRLCYVDTIPETVYDLTPESKAWKKTPEYRAIKKRLEEEVKKGLRNSIYDWDSPLMYRVQCFDAPNPNYHKGKAELYAYFTEVPLVDQWGDDWDDAPYEHNAGRPYDDHYQGDERKEHLIIKVPFYVRHDEFDVKLPMDYGCYGNSPFCVRDINAGAVAWIFARGLESKCIDGIAIRADYYFVDEFIEDYTLRVDELPDDATPELQRVLKRNKKAYWTGCFDVGRIWVYLNDKREEMLESLIQSRDYQLVHKLNKIEKKLFGAKEATPMNLSNEYYKSTGIRDLYESYESRVGTVECLGSAISRFTDAFWAHVNNEDMRVVFQVW